MRAEIVSRRYARALFALGMAKGLTEAREYGDVLGDVSRTVNSSPQLAAVLKNPVFSVDEKKAVVRALLEKLAASVASAPLLTNFCLLLAENNRLSCLEEITDCYHSLTDQAQGLVRGELTTAIALDSSRQEGVKKQLTEQLEKELSLEFCVDEAVLGGIVLRVGNTIFDASLRAELESMKEQIRRGEQGHAD